MEQSANGVIKENKKENHYSPDPPCNVMAFATILIRKLSICMMDGFSDGKTSNIAS